MRVLLHADLSAPRLSEKAVRRLRELGWSHAAHLQTYAQILERDGDEDEARLLRDAAAIVESWGSS